jgi:hypothetical protein
MLSENGKRAIRSRAVSQLSIRDNFMIIPALIGALLLITLVCLVNFDFSCYYLRYVDAQVQRIIPLCRAQ